MTEYRCTTPESYPKPFTGHDDPAARQGFYENAENPEEAAQVLFDRFPKVTIVDVQTVTGGKACKAIRITRNP